MSPEILQDMKYTSLYLLLPLIFSHLSIDIYGKENQTNYLTGRVVDANGEGISYATIALQSKINNIVKVVALAACEDDGRFMLERKMSNGKYTLQISCVGYTSQANEITINEDSSDLGIFTINEGIELSELVVSAQRKYVTTKVDRLIYNVEDDPDAATSNTLQILDKVPFIEIDKQTNRLNVMGQSSNYKILIDGKESLMLSEDNQHVAEILQAASLKEIELITSPDGKYYSNTAVINIITKSALADGIAGKININGSDQIGARSGLELTSKVGKFIYNIKYNYVYSDEYGSEIKTRLENYTSENIDNKFINSYSRYSPSSSNQHVAGLNFSYDFSKNDLLSAKFSTDLNTNRASSFSKNTDLNDQSVVTKEYQTFTKNRGLNNQFAGSLNYQRSFENNPGRLFTATYSIDNRDNQQKYDEVIKALVNYENSQNFKQNNLKNLEHTVALDFYSPISDKQSYYITTKYVNRDYQSDATSIDMGVIPHLTTLLGDLNYNQHLASIQGNYSIKWEKLMLTAELGFDYTWDNIYYGTTSTSLNRRDGILLGSLRATYRPNSKNFLILNFARQIFRPDISYLNPYEDTSVAGKITKGNPNLENENHYWTSFIYRFFLERRLSLNFISMLMYSGNQIQNYAYFDTNTQSEITTFANIGKGIQNGYSLRLDYNLDKLSSQLGVSMKYRKFEHQDYKNSYWTPSLDFNLEGTFWKGFVGIIFLSWAVDDRYNSESEMQVNKRDMNFNSHIYLSQKIGSSWQLYISANDPFNTYRRIEKEETLTNFYRHTETRKLGRSVSIGVIFNFGQFKDGVKAARRAIQNTDRTRQE